MVDFTGGGACWDEFTCGFADAIFQDNVDWIYDLLDEELTGIYNRSNPDNPVRDYHHVVIPYCTGDVHWGEADVVYGEGTANEISIRHRGAINTRAVLDWIEANYGIPEQVFVTGCSAGAYGSIMWSAEIARRYPEADLVQLGDSGAGIITAEWFANSFPSWNVEGVFPAHIPTLDPDQNDIVDQDIAYLYTEIASFYTQHRFSQFHAYADNNQVFYFQAMGGGTEEEWTSQMLASLDNIHANTSNFYSYIGPGRNHCIIPSNAMYSLEVEGTKFTDWLSNLLHNQEPSSIKCTVCDAK